MAITWQAKVEHAHHDEASDWEYAVIERARSDPHAFAPLYESYFAAIHGYCLRRLRNPEQANDATSQTFVKALTNIGKFKQRGDGGSTFRSWLFTIAHNVVIDSVRRQKPTASLDAEHIAPSWLQDQSASPEVLAISSDDRDRIARVLEQLPDRQRRIVELRMSGLNGVEIAHVLKMSHGAVKSAQFRAYTTLRELLIEDAPPSYLSGGTS